MRTRLLVAAALLPLLVPEQRLEAQDFLFGPPRGQLNVRVGPVVHRANSDLFDFITSELTLRRNDFRAPSFIIEAAMVAQPQVDIVVGIGRSQTESRSEFRKWVDQDDQPIEQTTRLGVTPVTVSARYYPLPRGESITQLAWAPARANVYVGAGIGLTWYQLEQTGDFVSQPDLNVFTDDYESRSSGMTGHLLGGMEYWQSVRFGLNVEARYTWGAAPLTGDFKKWDAIDLSGLQAGVGLSIRW